MANYVAILFGRAVGAVGLCVRLGSTSLLEGVYGNMMSLFQEGAVGGAYCLGVLTFLVLSEEALFRFKVLQIEDVPLINDGFAIHRH